MIQNPKDPKYTKNRDILSQNLSQAGASSDSLLDVRSPAEFAEDHIPGASNFPVLSDSERAHIGTLHQQVSAFDARREGAVLVSRNIAKHIEQSFADKPKDWEPFVYCWRGGSRSKAMTHILRSIGWFSKQLPGGYKSYRRSVIDMLKVSSSLARFTVLCGKTGVGKSRLLEALQAQGAQILDLEKFANHRGSVLGEPTHGEQPSQKWFESLVCDALFKFDMKLPIYVEAESKRIGRITVPEDLMSAIRSGQCVRIETSLKHRKAFLINEYHHFIDDPDYFEAMLQRLKPYIGAAQVEQWKSSFAKGDIAGVVGDLMEQYYDPRYLRSIRNHFPQYDQAPLIDVADITNDSLSRAACAIIESQSSDATMPQQQVATAKPAADKRISEAS